MNIFEFENYKEFVLERIRLMPKRGRGELRKISELLRLHTTSVSQVFRGNKELTADQASQLCEYLGLNEVETDYFLVLVQISRAQGERLRRILERQRDRLRENPLSMVMRIPRDQIFSEEDKAQFYSTWYYSAIRLLCSISSYTTVDAIASHLQLPKGTVQHTLDFLLSRRLIGENKNGFELGPKRTHLESNSPFVGRYHSSWRLKAMERFENLDQKRELVFTAPMSLSSKDVPEIRERLAKAAEQITAIAAASGSEELFCFNMDWIKI